MSEYAGWGPGDIYEMQRSRADRAFLNYPEEDDADVQRIYKDLTAPGGMFDPFSPEHFSEALGEQLMSEDLLHKIRTGGEANDLDAMAILRGIVMAYWHSTALEQALIDADELRCYRDTDSDYGEER